MPLVLWSIACAAGIALGAGPAVAWGGVAALAVAAAVVAVLAPGRRVAAAGAGLFLVAGALLERHAEGAAGRVSARLDPRVDAAIAAERAALVVARVARGPEWAGRGARLLVEIEA